MSATLSDATTRFLDRYEARRGALPGDRAARADAAQAFRAHGLPTVREEAWRYTNLRLLGDIIGRAGTEPADVATLLARLPEVDGVRVVLVDGRLRDDLRREASGVRVSRLADRPALSPTHGPARQLDELNAMLTEDGAAIEVAPGADGGVVLLASLATGAVDAFHPRHVVHVGEGARLTLLEVGIGAGAYLHNAAVAVQVDAGGVLLHGRIQDESRAAVSITTTELSVAASGMIESLTLNLGSRLTRAESHVRITGSNATAHLNAVQLLSGHQHGDVTTEIRHEAPHCASRQTVKNVLDDHARAVFQGKIAVAKIAQKTDAYQMNQSLLLSPDAEVDSKPQLEIFADDVKCSHGATIGDLDAEQLFYLRSRGLSLAAARNLLIEAFIADALGSIPDARLAAPLRAAIGARWGEWQS